jgi:hypothetical protein
MTRDSVRDLALSGSCVDDSSISNIYRITKGQFSLDWEGSYESIAQL